MKGAWNIYWEADGQLPQRTHACVRSILPPPLPSWPAGPKPQGTLPDLQQGDAPACTGPSVFCSSCGPHLLNSQDIKIFFFSNVFCWASCRLQSRKPTGIHWEHSWNAGGTSSFLNRSRTDGTNEAWIKNSVTLFVFPSSCFCGGFLFFGFVCFWCFFVLFFFSKAIKSKMRLGKGIEGWETLFRANQKRIWGARQVSA